MSYDYLTPREDAESRSYDTHYRIGIKHGYMIFRFEEEADRALFRLRFSNYVRPIEERHPRYVNNPQYPEHTEENIELGKGHKLHWKPADWTNE